MGLSEAFSSFRSLAAKPRGLFDIGLRGAPGN